MVATLLKLKFHLTIAELKRSTIRLILWIAHAVGVLFMLGFVIFGFAAISFVVPGNEALAGKITILSGSLLVLGWTLIPLVFFGFDQTLDPARFAPFPLTGKKLAVGLVLAGVLGLPGFFTAMVCLGSSLSWISNPLVVLVGLGGGCLGFLMTQLCCRLVTTVFSGALSTRKAKDLMGLIGLVLVLLLSMSGYAISVVISLLSTDSANTLSGLAVFEQISWVLSWTPLGSPWAIVADAGSGQWLMMLAHLGVTCGYLFLGFLAYSAALDKALIAPAQSKATGVLTKNFIARITGLNWVKGAFVPVAAIVARCLRYWRRDPRYMGQIIAILMMPIIFTLVGVGFQFLPMEEGEQQYIALFLNGMIAFGLGLTALMAGYTISADIAYDSTAWWIHLMTGVKGWQDRFGRLIAQMVVSAPLFVVILIVVPLIVGKLEIIPGALTAMTCLFLVSLGVSSVFSALIIYPIALPGESPLKMKTGMMGSQMLSQMGCLGIATVLALPICIWAVFASGWMIWVAFAVSLVWGSAVLVVGVILGGKIMDSRGPAIFAILKKNDSRERS